MKSKERREWRKGISFVASLSKVIRIGKDVGFLNKRSRGTRVGKELKVMDPIFLMLLHALILFVPHMNFYFRVILVPVSHASKEATQPAPLPIF